MKIALGIEYDGSQFNGWQTQLGQIGVRNVQTCLEAALSKVADHAVNVICAGRTDSGVHGLGQVVHAEVQVERQMRAWVFGGNTHLPKDVSIQWAHPVPDDFHARFSAVQRHYRYVILNRPTRSALFANYATWYYYPLDVAKMQTAAAYLVGEHDFSAFRAQGCQAKSPLRNISRLTVKRDGERVIIDVSANAFLQHMVRNIAGVLMAIGAGKQAPDWAQQVLASRNRAAGGVTALPNGLYFMQVDYPEVYQFGKLSTSFQLT